MAAKLLTVTMLVGTALAQIIMTGDDGEKYEVYVDGAGEVRARPVLKPLPPIPKDALGIVWAPQGEVLEGQFVAPISGMYIICDLPMRIPAVNVSVSNFGSKYAFKADQDGCIAVNVVKGMVQFQVEL